MYVILTEEQKEEIFMQALVGRKLGGTLERWCVSKIDHPYNEGESYSVGYGYSYGDPQKRFGDGNHMRTSIIESVNEDAAIMITRNTVYVLGEKGSDEDLNRLEHAVYC